MNKITLKLAIEQMDKLKNESEWNASIFQGALGFGNTWDAPDWLSERLKSQFIHSWLCTDTWVGLKVYFLDGFAVAVSTQTARKSDENLYFLDQHSVQQMRAFCVEVMEHEEHNQPKILRGDEMVDSVGNLIF